MSNGSTTSSAQSNGIGFLGLLTIVLVILKALGYITWSWWLVFAPVLVGLGFSIVLMLIAGLIMFFVHNRY